MDREAILKAVLQYGGWKCVDVPGYGRWHAEGHFAIKWDAEGPETKNPPNILPLLSRPRGSAITFGVVLDGGHFLYREASNGAVINEAFRALFGDAEWFSAGTTDTFTATANGDVIGLVMPIDTRSGPPPRRRATAERVAELYADFSSRENGFAFDSDRSLDEKLVRAEEELGDLKDRRRKIQQEIGEQGMEIDAIHAAIRLRQKKAALAKVK